MLGQSRHEIITSCGMELLGDSLPMTLLFRKYSIKSKSFFDLMACQQLLEFLKTSKQTLCLDGNEDIHEIMASIFDNEYCIIIVSNPTDNKCRLTLDDYVHADKIIPKSTYTRKQRVFVAAPDKIQLCRVVPHLKWAGCRRYVILTDEPIEAEDVSMSLVYTLGRRLLDLGMNKMIFVNTTSIIQKPLKRARCE